MTKTFALFRCYFVSLTVALAASLVLASSAWAGGDDPVAWPLHDPVVPNLTDESLDRVYGMAFDGSGDEASLILATGTAGSSDGSDHSLRRLYLDGRIEIIAGTGEKAQAGDPESGNALWLWFGPRRLVSSKSVVLSLIFPLSWLVFTLTRGAIMDWYPYAFIDAARIGYGSVALNCVWLTLLLTGLGTGAAIMAGRLGLGRRGLHA